MWERILPVQDSRCPQDATLTGEGAQNLQDQMLNEASWSPDPVKLPPPPQGPEARRRLFRTAGGVPGPSLVPNNVPWVLGACRTTEPRPGPRPRRQSGSPRTRLNSWPKGGTHVARKGNCIEKKKEESSAEPQRRLSQKYYFFYCYFIRFLYFFFFDHISL